jgi:hypothetical protein
MNAPEPVTRRPGAGGPPTAMRPTTVRTPLDNAATAQET